MHFSPDKINCWDINENNATILIIIWITLKKKFDSLLCVCIFVESTVRSNRYAAETTGNCWKLSIFYSIQFFPNVSFITSCLLQKSIPLLFSIDCFIQIWSKFNNSEHSGRNVLTLVCARVTDLTPSGKSWCNATELLKEKIDSRFWWPAVNVSKNSW